MPPLLHRSFLLLSVLVLAAIAVRLWLRGFDGLMALLGLVLLLNTVRLTRPRRDVDLSSAG